MSFKSTQHYKDNPGGERLPEDWNSVGLKKMRYITTKNGDALVVEMEDEEGRVATDFLYDGRDNAKIAQLADIAGVTWGDGTSGDEIAELFTANLFRFDVKIKWGQGDKCFVQGYAPQGSQQKSAAPQAVAAQPVTNGAARPARKF